MADAPKLRDDAPPKEVAVHAWNDIERRVREHLTPEISVDVDWIHRDQAHMAMARWRPTQGTDAVRGFVEVMPDPMASADTWPVVARQLCSQFDNWLKNMERDAELWRVLQNRLSNRWWRRLWRRFDCWAHYRFSS
jgi:hypothetical protein